MLENSAFITYRILILLSTRFTNKHGAHCQTEALCLRVVLWEIFRSKKATESRFMQDPQMSVNLRLTKTRLETFNSIWNFAGAVTATASENLTQQSSADTKLRCESKNKYKMTAVWSSTTHQGIRLSETSLSLLRRLFMWIFSSHLASLMRYHLSNGKKIGKICQTAALGTSCDCGAWNSQLITLGVGLGVERYRKCIAVHWQHFVLKISEIWKF